MCCREFDHADFGHRAGTYRRGWDIGEGPEACSELLTRTGATGSASLPVGASASGTSATASASATVPVPVPVATGRLPVPVPVLVLVKGSSTLGYAQGTGYQP